jgi:hypothetical protein
VQWNPPADSKNPYNQIWYYRLLQNNQLLAEVDNIYTSFIDSAGTHRAYQLAAVNYFFKESDRNTPKFIQTP